MGLDERLYLDDGWTGVRSDATHTYRMLRGPGAGLIVPLHGARPYRFGVRARLEPATPVGAEPRLQLLANDRVIGGWPLGGEWSDLEIPVPEQALQAGRNRIRLRLADAGEATAAVSGVWMEPEL
jgi:hypothetical protein